MRIRKKSIFFISASFFFTAISLTIGSIFTETLHILDANKERMESALAFQKKQISRDFSRLFEGISKIRESENFPDQLVHAVSRISDGLEQSGFGYSSQILQTINDYAGIMNLVNFGIYLCTAEPCEPNIEYLYDESHKGIFVRDSSTDEAVLWKRDSKTGFNPSLRKKWEYFQINHREKSDYIRLVSVDKLVYLESFIRFESLLDTFVVSKGDFLGYLYFKMPIEIDWPSSNKALGVTFTFIDADRNFLASEIELGSSDLETDLELKKRIRIRGLKP